MMNVIERAQSLGSVATTHAGARRWLLAHMPETLPGLRGLSGQRVAGGHRSEVGRGGRTQHAELSWRRRIAARADVVAAAWGYAPRPANEFHLHGIWSDGMRQATDGLPHADYAGSWRLGDILIRVQRNEQCDWD